MSRSSPSPIAFPWNRSGHPWRGQLLETPWSRILRAPNVAAMPLLTDLFPAAARMQVRTAFSGRSFPQPWSPCRALEIASRLRKAERAERFVTPSSGRNIESRVGGYDRIVDLDADAESEPIVRYGYRSFDRQRAFTPSMAGRPRVLTLGCTRRGTGFLVTKPTFQLGKGPAAVASAHVPDLHFFRGSYGGKDVIPLLRHSRRNSECRLGGVGCLCRRTSARRSFA